jgi:putative hydrolase of the HAD superfamily
MIEAKNIKAILFDSGRTLNVPRTGHWFITPNFLNIIDISKLKINEIMLASAMKNAYEHINKILIVKNEEEEFQMFRKFYSIVLKEIKYPKISDDVITELARDNVFNDDKFQFFDEVEESLKILSERFVLGVVSDTWPSLERVFINKGLRSYFATFIMSSIYGSYKAEKRLFKIALKELGLQPEEAIFVDDSEINLIAAEEFGMVPVLIDRYGDQSIESRYPIIRSLKELEELR